MWSRKTTWSKGHLTLWVRVLHSKSLPASFSDHRHCGSGNMFSDQRVIWIYREPLSHPAKFIDHRECLSGDIMFSEVEKQDSTCSQFNPPLQFMTVYTAHSLKARHIMSISPILVTRAWRKIEKKSETMTSKKKNTIATFVSPSKNSDKKAKEKNIGYCKGFCFLRQWRRSGVFTFNFEHIWHLFLTFLLLTFSK